MMILVMAAPIYASEEASQPENETGLHHVVDSEGLLSEKNRQKIETAAQSVYESNGVDLFAYITGGELSDPDGTGEEIYRSSAYTKSSVVMMVDSSNAYIRTYGRALNIFTGDDLEEIVSEAVKQKNDAALLLRFVKLTGKMLTEKGVQPVPDGRLQPRLVDGANLLTESQRTKLLANLDAISEKRQLDVVIVTNDSLGEKTVDEFADDFYDYNGYGYGEGYDGILLLVSMDTREWAISTCGKGITVFTDEGQEYMTEEFVSYMSDKDYYGGFRRFAELCDEFIEEYDETGRAYDYGHMPKEPFNWLKSIGISAFGGLIVGLIVALSLKSQLTSVKAQTMATAYTKQGSLKITERTDLFLYHTITRVAKPKDTGSSGRSHSGGSSTHHSSSGRSHGGSHGHF